MDTLTNKKYLCVIRDTEDFITNDGYQYRGYYMLAADKLSDIRAAFPKYSPISEACIFKRGENLAVHTIGFNDDGEVVILRIWRGDIFLPQPPASIYACPGIGGLDDDCKDMLYYAKELHDMGLARVDEM